MKHQDKMNAKHTHTFPIPKSTAVFISLRNEDTAALISDNREVDFRGSQFL